MNFEKIISCWWLHIRWKYDVIERAKLSHKTLFLCMHRKGVLWLSFALSITSYTFNACATINLINILLINLFLDILVFPAQNFKTYTNNRNYYFLLTYYFVFIYHQVFLENNYLQLRQFVTHTKLLELYKTEVSTINTNTFWN